MDIYRFDTLVRALPGASSRRAVVRLVLGILAPSLAIADAAAKKRKGKRKKPKRRTCKPPCPACQNCVKGRCRPGPDKQSCGVDQICQQGQCVGICAGKECGEGCGNCPANRACVDARCVAAPDQCPGPVGICNATQNACGTTGDGEFCGCELSTEGNNVCINGTSCPTVLGVCTSTGGPEATSCRNLVGLGYFCQEAKRNAQGQFCGCGFGTLTGRICMPACPNPL